MGLGLGDKENIHEFYLTRSVLIVKIRGKKTKKQRNNSFMMILGLGGK
jgi:hypothetical protein